MRPLVTMNKHKPGCSNVQRKPEKRHNEENRRENRKIKGFVNVHANKKYQYGKRDAEGQKNIHKESVQWDNHDEDNKDNADCYEYIAFLFYA